MNRRWAVVVIVVVLLILVLPMPVAERYTSPTQDGQYLGDPIRAYRFLLAAATVSPSAALNTSGEALAKAKSLFEDSGYTPNKVELLFLGEADSYEYLTESGSNLFVPSPGSFIWEVWGLTPGEPDAARADVIALLDYETGELLASVK
ncbi:MAG: hypothetical protein ACYC33_03010 [Thermoleophilia bacterium]